MSKTLLAGAVAGMLALTPTGASAAKKQPPPPQCVGLIGQCQGYRYMCKTAFYPKQLAVFTNLDSTEDWYEAVVIGAAHPWHCSGTPD